MSMGAVNEVYNAINTHAIVSILVREQSTLSPLLLQPPCVILALGIPARVYRAVKVVTCIRTKPLGGLSWLLTFCRRVPCAGMTI